jgi:hypothetical protein
MASKASPVPPMRCQKRTAGSHGDRTVFSPDLIMAHESRRVAVSRAVVTLVIEKLLDGVRE